MKRVFGRIILCVSSLATLASCSGHFESKSDSGNASVLTFMPNAQGTYEFQPFELIGLSDLKAVAGQFVNFMVAPRIEEQGGRQFMAGSTPRARYIRSGGGVHVASDQFSLELFTIYAHMQKLAALDKEVGAEGVNKWPRDIGVAVRVEGGLENNAQYYGPADAMFFVRYTKSNLPIAVNAGVLAHEHFHSLFFKLVKTSEKTRNSLHSLSKLTEHTDADIKVVGTEPIVSSSSDDGIELKVLVAPAEGKVDVLLKQDANDIYLRGLNEGFADFWGWMYTGDPDFIALSLPSEKSRRTLKVQDDARDIPVAKQTIISRLEVMKNDCNAWSSTHGESCFNQFKIGYAYEVGSRFARLLKVYTEKIAQERRLESQQARRFVAKVLIQVLPLIEENSVDAENMITLLAKHTPELKVSECEYLQSVVNMVGSRQWKCDSAAGVQLVETP